MAASSLLPNLLKALFTVSFISSNQPTYKSVSKSDPDEIYCYTTDNDKPQRQHYALQTPHHEIEFTETYKLPGCVPTKIWMVSRHGTRFPSAGSLKGLARTLPPIRNQITRNNYLCESDYELLKSWGMNPYAPPCALTKPQGFRDLHQLASFYRKMYPNLFPYEYTPNFFKFGHTSATRTKQSCAAFTEELFGRSYLFFESKNWINDNAKLRPWLNCPLYSKNAQNLSSHNSQVNLFRNTKHYKKIQCHVARRLGLDYVLNSTQIDRLWEECRYQETYNLKRLSPFCAAFNLHETKILEYLSDISLYYQLSYGNSINTKIPCAAIKDMIETMGDNESSHTTTVYFSHAELLLMMLAALGAYKDAAPLLYNNYEQMKQRKFRSSNLVPYASHIAAVKYYCPAIDDNKILMLLNKKPLFLPFCKHGSVCTVDEMMNFFNNSTMANCPNDICGPDFGKVSKNSKYEQPDSC